VQRLGNAELGGDVYFEWKGFASTTANMNSEIAKFFCAARFTISLANS
jgi:hypothetical protein